MFKKRIGITQKIVKNSRYNEVMDCLDTNWAKLLISLDILPMPLPLTSAQYAYDMWKDLALDGLILSGGNTLFDQCSDTDAPEGLCEERDIYEKTLLKIALSTGTPILGVCRGLQLINVFYNGELVKIKHHAGTSHRLIAEDSITGFELPSEVNSFHDCGIPRNKLGKGLICLAQDGQNNVEAFYHPQDKVLGIMWHPERGCLSLQADRKLLKEHFGI